MDALRSNGAQRLGITLNLTNAVPRDSADPVDVEAARRLDSLANRIFLDPLLRGAYPDDTLRDLEPFGLAEVIHADDLAIINAPLDFLGVNHYHDDLVSGHADAAASDSHAGGATRSVGSPWIGSEYITFPSRGLPRTAMDWEVNPDGLRLLLVRLGAEYDRLPPLYVTENGAAYDDRVSADGGVHDPERTDYIASHIDKVGEAIAAGADVRGYFVWSLLDNFEWSYGYQKRFGIVRVDYDTLERTVKDSGRMYAAHIRAAHAA